MTTDQHLIRVYETVDTFRREMLGRLTLPANLEKVHWSECDNNYLFSLMKKKVDLLEAHMKVGKLGPGSGTTNQLLEDIANFAMMLHDNANHFKGNNDTDFKGEVS